MKVSGIYRIRCLVSGKLYVGSSKIIKSRWYQHRRDLRLGKHASPRLQRAWNKHGEAAFVFEVIEECDVDALFIREQFHIDALKPDYNSMLRVRVISKEMREKARKTVAAKMLLHTHCGNGHEYTSDNTYVSPRGDRRCKQCNTDRSNKFRAGLTEEERSARTARLYARRREMFGFAKHSSPEHIAKIVAKTRGIGINRIAIIRSAEVRAAKTHCRNGHEYSVVGVSVYKRMRTCKGCVADYKRRRRQLAKAA